MRVKSVWTIRLFVLGLPCGFLIGMRALWLILPGWPVFVLAVLAAILLPTDAALGQPVITNPKVPDRARRALTVESGLNDGMALPLVLASAALAANAAPPSGGWVFFALKQITLGPCPGLIGHQFELYFHRA